MDLKLYDDYLYTRKLDLDLSVQQKNARIIQRHLTKEYDSHPATYFGKSSSTTKYYGYYNYLMMPLSGMTQLFNNIRETFVACNNHNWNNNPPDNEYYIQCWLNYYNKGEYIDWHSHFKTESRSWHGFYCVDVEPDSSTFYRVGDRELEVKSEDNLLVIGKSCGDMHRSSEWMQDKPRITIAFDISPCNMTTGFLGNVKNDKENIHYWIPLI